MPDMKVKQQISQFMQEVQNATMSDKDVFDEDYIEDVKKRAHATLNAVVALRYELEKHDL